jgi:hypothetical protein
VLAQRGLDLNHGPVSLLGGNFSNVVRRNSFLANLAVGAMLPLLW